MALKQAPGRRHAPLSEDEVGAIIEQELAAAEGMDGGRLASNREEALKYYYNLPMGTEVAGRSEVQSTDLADMCEAVVSQMMPAFAADSPAHFEAASEEDEDQAAMESLFVNHQIMARNGGYILIQEAVKDCLLQMNGVIKVWIEQRQETMTHRVPALDEEGVILALIPQTPTEEVELVDRQPTAPGSDLVDLTMRRTTTHKHLRLRAVAPENWRYQQSWNKPTLQGIRFCAERELLTRSELIDMGFDEAVVYDLGAYTMWTSGQQQVRHGGTTSAGSLGGKEPSTELIEVWDVYLKVDEDGDGVAEQHRIMYAGTDGTGSGGVVLEDVEVMGVPYAAGVAILRPHEFTGISLFEKLRQTQDIKTSALRQWNDNMASMNNRRIAYRGGSVDLVSLFTSKPGGGVECRDPHADINPIPVDDIGPSILQLLNYMDGVRTEQAGASLDFIDAEAQVAGTSGVAIEGQYQRKEMLAAMMCRNIAETLIAETYLLVHRTMRQAFQEPLSMRTGAGDWVQSRPSEWPDRERVNVKAGLSVGERAHKTQSLEAIIGQQKEALQNGLNGIVTSPDKLYEAVIDWGYARGLDSPEQYWIDPASPEAQQAAQQQAQQAEQQQAAMQQLQIQLAQMQVGFEQWKTEAELRFKYYDANLDAEVEEAKLVAQGHDNALDNRTNVTTEVIKQRGENRRAALSAASSEADDAA